MLLGRPSQGVWRKTSLGASRVGALWHTRQRPLLGHQLCAVLAKTVSNRLALSAARARASAARWWWFGGP